MRTKIVPLMAFVLGALVALGGAAAAEPNPDAPRWVDAEYEVSLDEGAQTLTLDGQIGVHKVQPSNRALEFHCGATCSADELREAYREGDESQKRAIVDGMEAAIEDRVDAALSSLAGSGAEPSSNATVDEASLGQAPEGDEYQPAIPIAAEGSAQLGMLEEAGLEPGQIDALFAMGARVDQPITQQVRAGTNLTLSLSLPGAVEVVDAQQATLAGGQATWTVDNWRSGDPASIDDNVTLADPSVEVPTESDAEVSITLDISEVGVEYTSLMGSDAPAQADVAVAIDGRFSAIENPRGFDRVRLDHLSADAVRIALANDLLETSQLIALEDRAREQIKTTFEDMVGEQVRVAGGFPAGDLSEDEIGQPAGTGEAITLSLSANATVPFPPEQQAAGASAFTVTTLSLGDMQIPALDVPYNVDTSMTFVLPDGLELNFEQPPGYEVTEHEQDGRKAYTFAATEDGGGEATIQNSEIVVNHPFVWDLFWPVLVTLGLLLVVLPAVVIGLTIRRRRRQGPETTTDSTPVAGGQASQRSDAGEE